MHRQLDSQIPTTTSRSLYRHNATKSGRMRRRDLMNDPVRIKQLSLAHAHLLSAKRYVSISLPLGIPDNHVALAEVQQRLPEEVLLSCMDLLASRGLQECPRAGFWRDMERAAETLGRLEQAAAYRARFLLTLGNPIHAPSRVHGD